jgi:hypothetical protein
MTSLLPSLVAQMARWTTEPADSTLSFFDRFNPTLDKSAGLFVTTDVRVCAVGAGRHEAAWPTCRMAWHGYAHK